MADDTRQKMLRAKALIQQGEYVKARAILTGVEHPTAAKWIQQIDKRLQEDELGDPFAAPAPRPAMKAKPRPKRRRGRLWLAIVAATLVILAATVYLTMILPSQGRAERLRVEFDLQHYCLDLKRDSIPDVTVRVDTCGEWAQGVVDLQGLQYDSAKACRDRYPDLDSLYYDCLIAEDVVPIVVFGQ
jgi:hypothetical protein